MDAFISSLSVGIVVFASTNIDDIFIVSAFFSDARLAPHAVVIGQFVGIGTLVLVSVIAALLALAVPAGWVALLGLAPLVLGVAKLRALRQVATQDANETEEHQIQRKAHLTDGRLHAQVIAVAAVTIANGGDNLGVYIPLFSSAPHVILACTVVFTVMTALWCVMGYYLVNNRLAGTVVRRYGHVVLPFVLLALGIYILSGATVLFR